jgi:geranylgeranyl diphosphate synthase, type II
MQMIAPDLANLKNIFEEELEKSLERNLGDDDFCSSRLNQSIRYALKSGGKRLRPMLVLTMAMSSGKTSQASAIKLAMPAAIAVEYIHTYSLIHDDLPAMDDDDFRRGRLSVHRQFDEALAILAGDALLADAFYFALSSKQNPLPICQELAMTTGSYGLAAGQAEDLNPFVDKNALARIAINKSKTARLFMACSKVGALAVDADKTTTNQAQKFGQSFGLAFQMQDDYDDKDDAYLNPLMLRDQVEITKTMCENFPNSENLRNLIEHAFVSY